MAKVHKGPSKLSKTETTPSEQEAKGKAPTSDDVRVAPSTSEVDGLVQHPERTREPWGQGSTPSRLASQLPGTLGGEGGVLYCV